MQAAIAIAAIVALAVLLAYREHTHAQQLDTLTSALAAADTRASEERHQLLERIQRPERSPVVSYGPVDAVITEAMQRAAARAPSLAKVGTVAPPLPLDLDDELNSL